MKKLTITLLLLLFATYTWAQQNAALTTTVQRTYYVMDLNDINAKIDKYRNEQKVDVLSMNRTSSYINLQFLLTREQYTVFLRESVNWGKTNEQKVNSQNYIAEVSRQETELIYLKTKKEEYSKLIDSLDKNHPEYLDIWREIRKIDEKIHRQEKSIKAEKGKHAQFEVKIMVYQEKNPTDYTNFSLVNMPGVEYAYLGIENPKADFSASKYHGIFLKYMFTRGKTYSLIGAFKDFENTNSGNQIDELFVFALGQDFYSRYLGRGAKKSMNLYSSFNGGYILATSENAKWNSWYMSAFIGLELLKTKYVLLDNKIGYFIPFTDSRNMRGLSYRVSFNFVF